MLMVMGWSDGVDGGERKMGGGLVGGGKKVQQNCREMAKW